MQVKTTRAHSRVHKHVNPLKGSVGSEAKVAGPCRAQRSEYDAQEQHSHHYDVHDGGGGEWRADEQASRLLLLVAARVGPQR